jgi:hypothetical protein
MTLTEQYPLIKGKLRYGLAPNNIFLSPNFQYLLVKNVKIL